MIALDIKSIFFYFEARIYPTRASGANLSPVSGLQTFVMSQLVHLIALHLNYCLKAIEFFWLLVQGSS